ncbi:CotH kinase family protein [Flavilitoribacter nigricans]|nr:CotH kinase family protein [Flavilitoribacter nigricans]
MQSLKLAITFCFLTGSIGLFAQDDFFKVDQVQQIHITFEQEDWRYLLDSLRYNGEELLPATVRINDEELEGVGVRYREGRAFTPAAKRNGLFLQLDLKKDGQAYQGYTSIDLSDGVRDPSMLREVLAHEIAQPYLPAPRANFAKVFINEELYGLFSNIEVIGKQFLTRNFAETDGTLFAATPDYIVPAPEECRSKLYASLQVDNSAACYQHNFTALQNADWTALFGLAKTLQDKPGEIEKVLNIDKTLWMLAFNNVLANLSSYSGQYSPNYLLYRDESGRFVPIITGFNFAFGSYKNTGTGSDLGTVEMLQLDPMLHADDPSKPLISVLLGNEKYQKQYLAHMRTLINNHFKDDTFNKRVEALQLMVLPDLAEDENKYYTLAEIEKSLTTTIGRKSKIPGLVAFMNKRISYLENHPAFRILPPAIEEVEVRQRERFSNEKISDFRIRAKVDQYTNKVVVYYRFSPEETFTALRMMDDGGHFDEGAGDNIYGAIIEPSGGKDQLEYYIQAENAKAISYDPIDYTVTKHKVSLAELNQ